MAILDGFFISSSFGARGYNKSLGTKTTTDGLFDKEKQKDFCSHSTDPLALDDFLVEPFPFDPIEGLLWSLDRAGQTMNYFATLYDNWRNGTPMGQVALETPDPIPHPSEISEKEMSAAVKLRLKSPESVPIILSFAGQDRGIRLRRSKLVINKDVKVGRFIQEIRKLERLEDHQAIFLFTDQGPGTDARRNARLVPISWTIGQLDSGTGTLRLYYTFESCFGSG